MEMHIPNIYIYQCLNDALPNNLNINIIPLWHAMGHSGRAGWRETSGGRFYLLNFLLILPGSWQLLAEGKYGSYLERSPCFKCLTLFVAFVDCLHSLAGWGEKKKRHFHAHWADEGYGERDSRAEAVGEITSAQLPGRSSEPHRPKIKTPGLLLLLLCCHWLF